MTDIALYAIILAFVIWEAIAHYVFHNQGAHTLSNRIAWLERKGGWPARVVVAGAIIALGVHLQLLS